jgi:hypothetical protein
MPADEARFDRSLLLGKGQISESVIPPRFSATTSAPEQSHAANSFLMRKTVPTPAFRCGGARWVARLGFDQDFLSLPIKLGREDARSRCIAFGSRQRLNQSRLDHIVGTPEDRNRCCRLLCTANCSISDG